MNVELLWWEGCPSTERALAAVREALGELDLSDVEVRMREVKDDGDARETGFVGSPTSELTAPVGSPEPAAPEMAVNDPPEFVLR